VLGRQAIGLEEVVEGDEMVHGDASIKCPAITILTSPKKEKSRGGEVKKQGKTTMVTPRRFRRLRLEQRVPRQLMSAI
jgi:hypothetical protein